MSFFKDSKKILHIALPLLSSRIMNVIVYFSGFIMIAKLGPKEFAAAALANSIFVTILLISVGTLYAIGIKVSYSFGAKNYKKIREYFYSGVLLSILMGILGIIILIGISYLLPYLGQDPTLVPYAEKFMHALCIPMIPGLLSIACNQLVIALQKPRIVIVSSTLNVFITISSLYLLIFGRLGLPQLGIWGFGFSFFIGDIFLILTPVIYVLKNPYFKQFNLTDFTGVGSALWKRMKEIVKLGIPTGLQFGIEVAAFSVITFLVGRFGILALNAFQIATQIVIIALRIPLTISNASAILVGQALGKKNPIDIRNYGFSSTKLAALLITLVSIIFICAPKLLIRIYINIHDPSLAKIVHLSILFLYMAAISQIFDAMRNVLSGSLRGLHDAKYPMYVGTILLWIIALPVGALLAFYFNVGPIGFQFGILAAMLTAAITLFIRFHQKSKPENIDYDVHD